MEQQRTNNTHTNQTIEQTPHQQRAINSSSPPAISASPAQRQRTANAGLPRRRIKWTHEMNVSVLKAYFKATRNNSLIGYRQQMHSIFIAEHPELSHLTQQNLADRRSAIMRNNLIPPTLQEDIRQSVINEGNQEDTQQNNQILTQQGQIQAGTQENINTVETQSQTSEQVDLNRDTIIAETDENISAIKSKFNEAKIKFLDMGLENRPHLPRRKPNRELFKITSIINTEILPTEIPAEPDYKQIIGLIYCSAFTITQLTKHTHNRTFNLGDNNNSQTTTSNTRNRTRQEMESMGPRAKPRWMKRLQQKIEETRQDLGFITSYINNRISKRKRNKLNNIRRRHFVHTQFDPPNQTIEAIRDTIKQKLAKYTVRLRGYIKSYNRVSQNRLFENNEKKFYSTIANPAIVTNPSTTVCVTEVESFWKAIWSQEVEHNPNSNWIDSIKESAAHITPMNEGVIDRETFGKAVRRLHNWKQPGCDKIHNFYYKYLTSLHDCIIDVFNCMVRDPSRIPKDMCKGITYLKPKVDTPTTASQYRPITCLNTGYKLMTSCIAIRITEHCKDNKIIAEQQKGCRKGTKGCKDQLVIDSVVTNQAIKNKKNLHTAFIDYQKAFDSIPHSWLLEVLNIYKINPIIINCVKRLMMAWETGLHIGSGRISRPIRILRGIYQGDSLSPLLFCLGLNPLSTLLTQSQYGYKLKTTDPYRISHCLYMDDLKLYANNKSNLDKLLNIVEIYTRDIRMQFGIEKCKTQSITRGKYSASENFNTADGNQITQLLEEEYYKYLGFKQHTTIDHTAQKKEITKDFLNRVYKISKSSLNGHNLIKAINTFAIPLLTYTFGIIAWSRTDLNDLDRKIRTTLTKTKHHHPRSSIERLNIPRKHGGRGLLSIEILHGKQINSLKQYFYKTAATSTLYQAVIRADDNLTPLNLRDNIATQPPTIENLIEKWKAKPLHGKYPNIILQEHIDLEQTNKWLKHGNIFSESEGFIIAIQDGVVNTRNYLRYIINDNTIPDDKCRRCGGPAETVAHLLSGCTALAPNHYKQRHDNVGKIMYIRMLKQLGIKEETTPYYKYSPSPIMEVQRYTIYWDRSILINNPPDTNPPNRPDMIVIDKQKKTATIIDFAVPYDSNIAETINIKKSKYHQLAEYMRNTQSLNHIDMVPIVIGSMGTVPKETTNAITSLKLNPDTIGEMQKAVLIGAVSIMRESLGWT